MKNLVCVFVFTICFIGLSAQTTKYKGTMQYGSYTRENVIVEVQNNNPVTIIMYNVKFSRFMPLTVDMTIKGLQKTSKSYSGTNIVPLIKQTPHEKYIIKTIKAVADNGALQIEAVFGVDGSKKMIFSGKLMK